MHNNLPQHKWSPESAQSHCTPKHICCRSSAHNAVRDILLSAEKANIDARFAKMTVAAEAKITELLEDDDIMRRVNELIARS